MQNNLYKTINNLVERKYELKRIGGYIKHDKTKREEFIHMVEEYNKIDETLDYIIHNCFISPLKVAKIISSNCGILHKLKIFTEVGIHDGKKYSTDRFIACYLNNKNKYFNFDKNGVSFGNLTGIPTEKYINYALSKQEFDELVSSLNESNSYILATSSEQSFIPTLFPSAYLEGINFVKLFIYGRVDDFVSLNFQRKIRNDIKQYLENIDSDKFLNQNQLTK